MPAKKNNPRTPAANGPPGRPGRKPAVPSKYDEMEIESAVCELICMGLTVKDLRAEMKRKYGKDGILGREKVYAIMRAAAKNKRLRYHPEPDFAMKQFIENRYAWLQRANVVFSLISKDIAREAAMVLRGLVQERHRQDRNRGEVHIGLAAGLSMRQLAQAFADLLRERAPDLPPRIFFHAMVTGHEKDNPTTDPNAFFTFFLSQPVLVVEPRFVGLHAPTMVTSSSIPELKENYEIREAFNAVDDLDIIATSGSDWGHEHSSLHYRMKRSPESLQLLQDAGVVGDMLWRPLSTAGPIELETDIRALTLVELSELPDFLKRGKRVLLMLGPCGHCSSPKGRILHTILNQPENLVSHVVADSRTVGQCLEIMGERDGLPMRA